MPYGLKACSCHPLMRERDRLKKAAIKSGSNASWSAYRSMRNHVDSSIKESKKQFINDGIVKSGKNTQQVWKHLRYVVPGKDKNNCINKIKVDDNIESTDPQVISNTLRGKHSTVIRPRCDNILR